MKTKILLPLIVILIMTTSCSKIYYQVYKTEPTKDKAIIKENYMIFEDENCAIFYDLWNNGGNIGFRFLNKTDRTIIINLEDCYFVVNGLAYNYYQNRIFTSSANSAIANRYQIGMLKSITGLNSNNLLQTNELLSASSAGAITTSGYSVSYQEENKIKIPSRTSKIISEFEINNQRIIHCELIRYPKPNEVKTVFFDKSESPLVFSNRIAYTMEGEGTVNFENEFYISEMTNYPENEITELKYEEICGQKSETMKRYFKNVSPNMFYLRYVYEM